jgi:hypothetical protein
MKYLCIKSAVRDQLIEGMIYDIEEKPGNVGDKFIIEKRWTVNEDNIREYFIPLAEIREQRINKILE